jgi:hypothetical protein
MQEVRMPTLDEALRFVREPRTSVEQLQKACGILGLPADGDADALRGRLLDHLDARHAEQSVVCLNPRE